MSFSIDNIKHSEDLSTNSSAVDTVHKEANADVFGEIFATLGDHNGFYIGPHHVCDLPIVLVDNGLHVYFSKSSMLSSGLFTEVDHSIVRTSDGQAPALDLSVTNLVVFQWIAIVFILLVFRNISKKKKLAYNKPPKGFLANVAEKIILYVRDEIVAPNIPYPKIVNSLTFYFVATFIFILVVNILGLLPGGHTATSAIPLTGSLALIAFFVINGAAIKYSGIKSWFKHVLGGAPVGLAPIMVPIEILTLFIKPFSLTIRLFANMTAGHIIILSFLGLLFFFNTYVLATIIVPFSVFLYLLELLVAFIQAFVFTMLVAIYTGQSIGDHVRSEH
jgi:F-type H+-transporting ATPase subunit a